MKLSGILLLVFAAVIGIATFIENDLGTQASKLLVYKSKWFEILLVLLAISMIGVIIKNNLLKRKKYSSFIFHISFVIILAGSSITRYFGHEGIMTIREGEKSNEIISAKTYVTVKINHDGKDYHFENSKLFSLYKNNSFNKVMKFGNERCKLSFVEFFQSAVILNLQFQEKSEELILYGGENILAKGIQTEINGTTFEINYGSKLIQIPFSLYLRDFQLERYPGSMSPSSFTSEVTLIDEKAKLTEDRRIFMNNVLNYKGYRFFQSSYDKDEKGTILSVNHDYWGTFVTYFGYFLMTLGMLLSFFHKKSRFRQLMRLSSKNAFTIIIIIGFGFLGFLNPQNIRAQNIMPNKQVKPSSIIQSNHAKEFGKLLVLNQKGRIEPINTLSSEIIRKVIKKNKFMGLNSNQIFLGMMSDPITWQNILMIKVSDPELKHILGIDSKYASFNDFFDFKNNANYKLSRFIDKAFKKKPILRSRFDKEVIKVDERLNICYMVYTGEFLKIFPINNNETKTWFNSNDFDKFDTTDIVFVKNILPVYYHSINTALKNGNWVDAAENLSYLKIFQKKVASEMFPSKTKIRIEILYNNLNIFKRLFPFYGLLGFIMLILLFISLLKPGYKFIIPIQIGIVLIIIGFILHTLGLSARWYISDHAPWSNGYESMIYIAWATILAGLFFIRKSKVTFAITVILASLTLMITNLSWMDPEITNLVPVLKSYWLVIHVAVITASYSFLAIGAFLGFFNLVLMNLKTEKNKTRLKETIQKLSNINEMNLIIGGFLLTVGTFLGAVWANESWGRYWGWDPKETWALITIIVYAFVIHMRMIPGMRGNYAFNFAALISFSSVLMTYFGVNFYLGGMHSYAQGDPVPIPAFVYYTLITITVVSGMAYLKEKKL